MKLHIYNFVQVNIQGTNSCLNILFVILKSHFLCLQEIVNKSCIVQNGHVLGVNRDAGSKDLEMFISTRSVLLNIHVPNNRQMLLKE